MAHYRIDWGDGSDVVELPRGGPAISQITQQIALTPKLFRRGYNLFLLWNDFVWYALGPNVYWDYDYSTKRWSMLGDSGGYVTPAQPATPPDVPGSVTMDPSVRVLTAQSQEWAGYQVAWYQNSWQMAFAMTAPVIPDLAGYTDWTYRAESPVDDYGYVQVSGIEPGVVTFGRDAAMTGFTYRFFSAGRSQALVPATGYGDPALLIGEGAIAGSPARSFPLPGRLSRTYLRSNAKHPIELDHVYQEPGTYLVTLSAVNPDGTLAASPATRTVIVTLAPLTLTIGGHTQGYSI